MTATALQSIIPFDQIVHFDLVWQPFGKSNILASTIIITQYRNNERK